MGAWFPVLLVAHITLAICLFLPSFLLPFTFRTMRRGDIAGPSDSAGPVTRTLLWLQGNGTLIIGLGVAATGIGLVVVLGAQVLGQPWLLAALSLYAANLALAFFIQRPGLRRLLRLPAAGSQVEQDRWRTLARRQRYVSYVMAAGIGVIGFLMSAKPGA
ncbi:hypothetical protein BH18CHL1_BH18CHL1_08460 [soil metagenome]